MLSLKTPVLVIALAGGLAACGPRQASNTAATPSAANTVSPSSATAPPAAAPAPTASAPSRPVTGPPPTVRRGTWEQVASVNGATQDTRRVCAGGVIDFTMGPSCQPPRISRTPTGGVVVERTCMGRDGAVEVRVVAEGDFNAHYTTDMRASVASTGRVIEVHTDSTYRGPC